MYPANITGLAGGIKPAGIYAYRDKVRVWLKGPVSKPELARLRGQCGCKDYNELARFDPSYVQRLDLYQPTPAALQWLARRYGARITYVELSLDWTFDDEDAKDAAYEFLCRHVVKKHHRDQGIRFVVGKRGTTRYSGPRRARNVLVMYRDKQCKVTGEVCCLHLDWRIHGAEALCRAGLASLRDLLAIDHREFWRTRLLLFALDPEALGRKYHNARRGTRRRKPWIISYPCGLLYNPDQRVGQLMLRGAGEPNSRGSVQGLIDDYAGRLDVRSCLIKLNVEHLLPATQYYDISSQTTRKRYNPLPRNKNTRIAPPPIINTVTTTEKKPA